MTQGERGAIWVTFFPAARIHSQEGAIPQELESSESLMRRYQEGDAEAFAALYRRHAPRVLGYLRGHLPAGTDAEDLLQQTFLSLHRYRERYDASLPFLPWVFAIARNALIDHLRKGKVTLVSLDAVAEPAAPQEVARGGEEVSWETILESVPAESRELFRLRFEQRLPFEEIAERLDADPRAVRKRASRLVARLRAALVGNRSGK